MSFPNQMYPKLLKNLCRFFNRRASFWVWSFKTPSPPSAVGRQTISHAALGGFLALMSAPLQRQCFLYLSTCSMTVLCSLKVLMKNMGKEVKMELVISSLPTCERKAEVYASRLSHRVTRGKKSITLVYASRSRRLIWMITPGGRRRRRSG